MINVSDVDYSQFSQYKDLCRGKGKDKTDFITAPCGFDTETTSTEVNGEKFAYVYEWTFGIGDIIIYGRYIEEFVDFLNNLKLVLGLDDEHKLPIYVQNLPFDFQFIRKYFIWDNVFATDLRNVIRADMDGFQFRDSYILSGTSLAVMAKNLTSHKIEKLVGDLDYDLVRNPSTPLSDKELKYCEYDVKIILYYIEEQISIYGSVANLPLTNTGRVRKTVRRKCFKNYKEYKKMMDCLTMDVNSYDLARRCFQGGFTHASMEYSGKTLENVHSIDFTSSYPSVMIAEKYPMSRPMEVLEDKKAKLKSFLRNDTLFVCTIEFTNIESILVYENYISESKCDKEHTTGVVANNGRVFSADKLRISLTSLDLAIIDQVYKFDDWEVIELYYFTSYYLPKPIIQSILEFYDKKTKLKGVKGEEVEYLLNKGMLNSIYGMMVQDIINPEIIFDNDEEESWSIIKPQLENEFEQQIDDYNDNRNRFTYYWHGVFVTAYARYNLWQGIIEIGKDGDYVYSDTDSIKFLNYDKHIDWINNYNKNVTEKIQTALNKRHIEWEIPKTVKGVSKPLGVWDYEGKYDLFKTIGAKRYLTYNKETDEYSLTCAGVSKKLACQYLIDRYHTTEEIFKHFDNELVIPSEYTGKQTHTYIDYPQEYDITDYLGHTEHIKAPTGIHLSKCEFSLSLTASYLKFLQQLEDGVIAIGSIKRN